MNFLSIKEWGDLARQDSDRWADQLRQTVARCIEKTGQAVISRDLAADCRIGDGPLSGVPYGLKDLFDFKGHPTHCSSVRPRLVATEALEDSDVVRRLNTLGASCAAKTQMNEFAYGLSGENPHYGNCPHPHLEGCLSGGSSSGSAHLVGAGYLPLAFGTDTGGSIRLPAAWCGLYGLRCRPHYETGGCFPLARSFDAVGWFTRTNEDMAAAVAAWFGDCACATGLRGSALMPADLVEAETFERLRGVVAKLGLTPDPAADALADLLPECNQAFNVLQSREAYDIHRDWLEEGGELYDPAVKARILRGKRWTEDEVAAATEVRATVTRWFAEYFERRDYLVMPVCPGPAATAAETTPDLREKILRLTGPASLACKPALTVPVPLGGGRTVGLQLIFNSLEGATVLGLLDLCKRV